MVSDSMLTESKHSLRLTHKIPAGPRITAPDDGDIVAHDANLCPSSSSSRTGSTSSKYWQTEKGGNQTITEGGVFCTQPKAGEDCEAP